MPRYDQEKMVKLVSELRASVGRLRELSKLSLKTFLNDPDKIGSAKYHFIVAIESSIDMCNHVIARNALLNPASTCATTSLHAMAIECLKTMPTLLGS
jgi:uncharacterized protein YutE (UPF0331/DUF86 family)